MKSLLYTNNTVLSEPISCSTAVKEVKIPIQRNGRVYTAVLRDKTNVEFPYIVQVKAAAFSLLLGESYMGKLVERDIKDFILKTSVTI